MELSFLVCYLGKHGKLLPLVQKYMWKSKYIL